MRSIMTVFLVLLMASIAQADTLTLTTYYPSPSGDYQDLQVMGNLGVGTIRPGSSLEVKSTTGGFIPPKMTTAQKTAMTAVAGGVVYDTTLNSLQYYDGSAWVAAGGGAGMTGGCTVRIGGAFGTGLAWFKWGNGCVADGTARTSCGGAAAAGYSCGDITMENLGGGQWNERCMCVAS
ncbi:MAG: hypothetical protein HQL17_01510 [Candidatus Omnitrophica bacterium]|nr:hypothetical protein [Candidatus Omnitrophota bacterium]